MQWEKEQAIHYWKTAGVKTSNWDMIKYVDYGKMWYTKGGFYNLGLIIKPSKVFRQIQLVQKIKKIFLFIFR